MPNDNHDDRGRFASGSGGAAHDPLMAQVHAFRDGYGPAAHEATTSGGDAAGDMHSSKKDEYARRASLADDMSKEATDAGQKAYASGSKADYKAASDKHVMASYAHMQATGVATSGPKSAMHERRADKHSAEASHFGDLARG
jgi:hypothetical protein